MKRILFVENVSKKFSGLQVLTEVSMEVLEGERHAIIGPNGAGKTTLFNLITGFYRPSSGRIFFLEKDITRMRAYQIARHGLSRSFQITTVFPTMTVYENVRSAIVAKLNKRFNWVTSLKKNGNVQSQSERLMDFLGLNDVRDIPACELSYGRQRHLELALTVARDPVLIMLDEPTAGLNSEETRDAVTLIRQVTEKKTLIMVEHDMDVVFNLADRITVLNNGRILAQGRVDEIRQNEEVREAYLGRKQDATQS